MENIKSLREICQKPRFNADTWYGRYFVRRISIYITMIFLQLHISADTVTLMFTILGIMAALCFAIGTKATVLLGVLLLQLWYILDHVDGEIARYQHKNSFTGIYFDEISHYIVHPLVFFLLGIGVYRNTAIFSYIVLGIVSGFSILMISVENDVKERTLLRRYAEGGLLLQKNKAQARKKDDPGRLKRVFILTHGLCTYPNIMNFITILAIIDFFSPLRLVSFVLYFYAIVATLIWVARVFFIVKTRQIDS